jgi:hypothetical protein
LPLFAVAFGLILGVGFLTFVTFIGYYLLLTVCLIYADPLSGGLVMASYGAARSVPLLLAVLLWRARGYAYDLQAAISLNNWIEERDRWLAWLRAGSLIALAGALAVSFVA